MERAKHSSPAAKRVGRVRQVERVRIDLDDRIQVRDTPAPAATLACRKSRRLTPLTRCIFFIGNSLLQLNQDFPL